MSICLCFSQPFPKQLYTVHHIYEKSRSGNKAGAIHVQIYKSTHIQLDVILTQSDAKLLLYVLKSFAGRYQLKTIQKKYLKKYKSILFT